jgi:hypothetical protein
MSIGSEKNTITSVVPAGVLVVKLGIVSSVNGWAATNGIVLHLIFRSLLTI